MVCRQKYESKRNLVAIFWKKIAPIKQHEHEQIWRGMICTKTIGVYHQIINLCPSLFFTMLVIPKTWFYISPPRIYARNVMFCNPSKVECLQHQKRGIQIIQKKWWATCFHSYYIIYRLFKWNPNQISLVSVLYNKNLCTQYTFYNLKIMAWILKCLSVWIELIGNKVKNHNIVVEQEFLENGHSQIEAEIFIEIGVTANLKSPQHFSIYLSLSLVAAQHPALGRLFYHGDVVVTIFSSEHIALAQTCYWLKLRLMLQNISIFLTAAAPTYCQFFKDLLVTH